jgi:capsular polysaccharide biosynthesis protein
MWTLLAIEHMLRKRLAGKAPRDLKDVADRTWEIAPGETVIAPPAHFLPNQLERVTGWAFAPEMKGGTRGAHAPTRAFLLREAYLIDGVLYKGDACSHLSPRESRWPRLRVAGEIERGAIFCTPGGNKYFGQWLMDDCPTYPLAAAEGIPVTTAQPLNVHAPGYQDWLGMKPTRLRSTFFREVVIFEDVGQNRHKHMRFRAMTDKLLSNVEPHTHPGVFILRGRTGERRLLSNEMELAEYLRDRRGFRIVDPTKLDVPTLVATCAGSRTVVGVEGSGLIHGILVLPPGGAVLTLQPPNRFVSLYKHLTDRDHQHFGFVVGLPDGADFRIDPVEVERTLDLFPQAVTKAS